MGKVSIHILFESKFNQETDIQGCKFLNPIA